MGAVRTFVLSAMMALYVIAGIVLYWMFWPVEVARFDPPDMLVLTGGQTLKPGDIISYRSRGENFIGGVFVDQTRTLIDGTVVLFTPTSLVTTVGPFDTINATLVVPMNTPTGRYKLQVKNVYRINPLRAIVVTRTSDLFEVVR